VWVTYARCTASKSPTRNPESTIAGLYLHIPFCTQRCVYCDFYFVTTSRDYASFVNALLVEIEAYGREYGAREPLETVYLGGGTPSLLPIADVARLMDGIARHFDLSEVEEVTFEVNPENATLDYLTGLRSLGVTRLSLGVQSFFDEDLRFMNRVHDATEAERSIDAIRRVGFETFSVDLIFGLPDQPAEHWMANLEKAARLDAPHLSTYGLTIEERTPLAKQVARGVVEPVSEEATRARFLDTMDYLRHHGYEHYEVSSFAQPGARSRHNQLYWRHGNYLGLGPSAHSFWRRTRSLAGRWSNVRNLRRYQALLGQGQRPLDWEERIGADDLADEYVLLRLRLLEDGLDLDVLEEQYGADLLVEKVDELAELESAGLVQLRNGVVRLTDEGVLVCDAVTAKLIH
jgi:oxygen-independent coproporphyrinogen-3 oxidase